MFNIVSLIISLMLYHPLHLGVVHFDVDESGQAGIEVKVFTDDLENAILHTQNRDFKMSYADKTVISEANQYIENHFNIKQMNKTVGLEFQKVFQERDVTGFKYTATIEKNVPFEVCCHIFYELFNDQTNLLIVNIVNDEEGYRLSSRKTCAHVE